MSKQKIILALIFIITLVLGLSVILLTSYINSQKQTTLTQSPAPSITEYNLYCSSGTSDNSLTLTWQSQASSIYQIEGVIIDNNTGTQIQFGPLNLNQESYLFSQADGTDTYYVNLWTIDTNGNKGPQVTTNQIDSASCTSGKEPVVNASTISPTLTQTPTQTPVPTTPLKVYLSCNSFTLSQNGTILTSGNVSPGSISISSNITTPLPGSSISYANANWSVSPSNSSIYVNTGGKQATWTAPSQSGKYTIFLSGVTDSKGNGLQSPCQITLSVSTKASLPDTGTSIPAYIADISAMLLIAIGIYILRRERLY